MREYFLYSLIFIIFKGGNIMNKYFKRLDGYYRRRKWDNIIKLYKDFNISKINNIQYMYRAVNKLIKYLVINGFNPSVQDAKWYPNFSICKWRKNKRATFDNATVEIWLKGMDGWRLRVYKANRYLYNKKYKKDRNLFKVHIFHPSSLIELNIEDPQDACEIFGDRVFTLGSKGMENIVKTLNFIKGNLELTKVAERKALKFNSNILIPEYVSLAIDNYKKDTRRYQNLVNDIDDIFRHRIMVGGDRFFKYIKEIQVYAYLYSSEKRHQYNFPNYNIYIALNDTEDNDLKNDLLDFIMKSPASQLFKSLLKQYGYNEHPIDELSTVKFVGPDDDIYSIYKNDNPDSFMNPIITRRVSIYNHINEFKGTFNGNKNDQ